MLRKYSKKIIINIFTFLISLIFIVDCCNLECNCFANDISHIPHGSFTKKSSSKDKTSDEMNISAVAYDDDDDDVTRWMGRLPDNALLRKINIPGTHDSGTYDVEGFIPTIYERAQCQDRQIDDQLNIGIRYLDIRTDDKGIINHGGLKCQHRGGYLNFVQVVYWVADFLHRNPSECVFLQITDEKAKKDIAPQINSDLSKYANWIYTGGKPLDELRLGDVRGKMILVARTGGINNAYSYGNWKNNTKLCDLEISTQQKTVSGKLQDFYKAKSAEEKFAAVTAFYHNVWFGSSSGMFLDFTSFWTLAGFKFIRNMANDMWHYLEPFLNLSLEQQLGVMLLDYPRADILSLVVDGNEYRNLT